MIADHHSDNYRPMGWWGQIPVYTSTLLVAVYVGAMLLLTLARATGAEGFVAALIFDPVAVMEGFQIWRVFTYPLVNPPSVDFLGYLWFAVQMYLLYVFRQEVEKFIGRKGFILLYSFLLLSIPLTLLVLNVFNYSSIYVGSQALNFAMFIAFATIYPRAQIFFQFEARWVALVLVLISSLSYLASNAWSGLAVLWVACGLTVLLLRRAGVGGGFDGFGEALQKIRPKPSSPAPRRRALRKEIEAKQAEREVDFHESIDPLLEKISQHGVSSLTKAERERLEKARHQLMSKDKSA